MHINKKDSISKNYIYNLLNQFIQIFLPLIIMPHVSRALGSVGIGTISYVEAIVAFFSLFGMLGVSFYGQREIAYCKADISRRSLVFWNLFLIKMLSSIVVFAIFIILTSNSKNHILYAIYSIYFLALIFNIEWFYQGIERFDILFLCNGTIKFGLIFFFLLMVNSPEDVYLYAGGYAISTFIINILSWCWLPKEILPFHGMQIDIFNYLKAVLVFFVPTIAIQIYMLLDKTMIGLITSDYNQSGFYEQAIKIARLAAIVITSLSTVLMSKISIYYSRDEKSNIEHLMYHSFTYLFFIGTPITFGLISISDIFIPWFYGAGFEGSIILLKILAFLVIPIGLNNIIGVQYLIATKRQIDYIIGVLSGMIINFVLNLVLIKHYQALGAAIASVVAETFISIILIIKIRDEFSIFKVIKATYKYWICSLIMYGIIYIVKQYCLINAFSIFIILLTGISTYIVLLALLKDPLLKNALRLIRHQ